jgi:hypothetical protein
MNLSDFKSVLITNSKSTMNFTSQPSTPTKKTVSSSQPTSISRKTAVTVMGDLKKSEEDPAEGIENKAALEVDVTARKINRLSFLFCTNFDKFDFAKRLSNWYFLILPFKDILDALAIDINENYHTTQQKIQIIQSVRFLVQSELPISILEDFSTQESLRQLVEKTCEFDKKIVLSGKVKEYVQSEKADVPKQLKSSKTHEMIKQKITLLYIDCAKKRGKLVCNPLKKLSVAVPEPLIPKKSEESKLKPDKMIGVEKSKIIKIEYFLSSLDFDNGEIKYQESVVETCLKFSSSPPPESPLFLKSCYQLSLIGQDILSLQHAYFKKMTPFCFMPDNYFDKEKEKEKIAKKNEKWTQVEDHFKRITWFVAETIIGDVNDKETEDTINARIRRLFWIHVLRNYVWEKKDYHSAMAIHAGMNTAAVQKLTSMWSCFKRNFGKLMNTKTTKDLLRLSKGDNNFKELKEHFDELKSKNQNFIPYGIPYAFNLLTMAETNQIKFDDENKDLSPETQINFLKNINKFSHHVDMLVTSHKNFKSLPLQTNLDEKLSSFILTEAHEDILFNKAKKIQEVDFES